MNSVKCMKCGLTNFADATECKRCGLLFVALPEFPKPPTVIVPHPQQHIPAYNQPNYYTPQMPMPNHQQTYIPHQPQIYGQPPPHQTLYNGVSSIDNYDNSKEKPSGSFLFKSFICWLTILLIIRFYAVYKTVDLYTLTEADPLSKSPMYNMSFYVEMGYSILFLIFAIVLYVKYYSGYKSFIEIAKGFLICNILFNLIDIVFRLIFVDEIKANIKSETVLAAFTNGSTVMIIIPLIPIALSAFMLASFIRLSDDDIDSHFYDD